MIQKHNLPVEQCVNYEKNSSGSCWYASIAALINCKMDEGKMSLDELKMKTKGPVGHREVRKAVCDFLVSNDFIMREFWINEYFQGNNDRYSLKYPSELHLCFPASTSSLNSIGMRGNGLTILAS